MDRHRRALPVPAAGTGRAWLAAVLLVAATEHEPGSQPVG
jgi:hypothetical protein